MAFLAVQLNQFVRVNRIVSGDEIATPATPGLLSMARRN